MAFDGVPIGFCGFVQLPSNVPFAYGANEVGTDVQYGFFDYRRRRSGKGRRNCGWLEERWRQRVRRIRASKVGELFVNE